MILLSRATARRFRAMLRQCVAPGAGRDAPPAVAVRAARSGLRLQARGPLFALEHHTPGSFPPEVIRLPEAALADVEGRGDVPVRVEATADGTQVSWQDGVVPQVRRYPAIDSADLPDIPEAPRQLTAQSAHFLAALRDARDCAGTDAVRYALTCLQLRGRAGQVVG